MNVRITTKKRSFDLLNLSEAEGLILRTLLNLSDEGITEALKGDTDYWEHEVSAVEAYKIGCEIRDKILEAVDQ
jgi:hypothetical protein